MFKVYHDMTHYEWSVDTKDELLSELDILNARAKHKQINDTIHIRHEHEDDVLETTTLELPVSDDIDNYLIGFGQSVMLNTQKRGGMFNAFKRLLSRGKNTAKDTPHDDKEINFVYGKDKPVFNTEDGKHEQVNISKTEIQETLYHEYDTVESSENEHVGVHSPINDVDNVARKNIIFDVANTSSQTHHLDDLVQHDKEKHTVEFLGDKSDDFDITDTMTVDKEIARGNNKVVDIEKTEDNSVETTNQTRVYLTKDTIPISELQREFMQRVNQEIAFIDEQVVKLLAKRKENEKLLHVLEHFDTIEDWSL